MVRGTALCRARLLQTRRFVGPDCCKHFATIVPDKAYEVRRFVRPDCCKHGALSGPIVANTLQQSGPTKRRTSYATIGPDKAPYLVCCLQQSGPTKRRRARLLHRTSFGVCNNRARQSAVPRLVVCFIVKRPSQ